MIRFRVKVRRPRRLLGGVEGRLKDLSPAMAVVPKIMRFGSGSLDQQIRERTHFTPAGGRLPWQDPAHEANAGSPNMKALLEDVMWQAVRGGPGSITRHSKFSASVGVNDQVIRQRSAELGNQIVSNAEYFGFVTGGFQERTTPARAKPSKPTRTGKGRFPFNTAMYWFLRLQFNYVMSEADAQSGLLVPPKNLGFNPIMKRRIETLLTTYIRTGRAVAAF